ncbi:hypothetical protein ACFOGI_15105 [Virgibacillus xinjiangensis]|uniref:Uncharacterized protein n=1 Tax=Virgibacillus xinjiangensis TaxID=393090 RepID=A0ABV7CZ50_9BACI
MGYQESYIRFQTEKDLRNEWKQYKERFKEKSPLLAEVVCASRAKKDVFPIRQGELMLVVVGERSAQKMHTIEQSLGIKKVKGIIPIDDLIGLAGEQHMLLDEFLQSHFHVLTREEEDDFLHSKRNSINTD